MIKAVSLSLAVDLREFSAHLQAAGVRHHINEESGQQVISVQNEADAIFVQRALQDWQLSGVHHHVAPATKLLPSSSTALRATLRAFRESPVSLCLIIVCLVVAIISQLGVRADRVAILFYPQLATDGFVAAMASLQGVGEAMRTLTPMFLHFGELHLVFNMLWLWYFGRQLEPVHPVWLFGLVILLTSFASNTTQYLYSNANNFGGMSGVVYGLVGYTWVVHNFMPRSRLILNNSTFVVFVIALIAMEVLASSWIASAAHVGGLVMGVILGAGIVVYYRVLLRRDSISK